MESLLHDTVQRGGNTGIDRTRGAHACSPHQRRSTGQHFVEDRAQSVDITGKRGVFGPKLGGQIGQARDIFRTRSGNRPIREVSDFDLTLRAEQNAQGTQIAVCDADPVGGGQAVRD